MNPFVCAITYESIPKDERYSPRGLKRLSKQLKKLKPLALTLEEQRVEAAMLSGKMSIQGVQVKLSARLSVSAEEFKIVERGGTYILKPAPVGYLEVPENEDLTMRLAATVGIQTPVHGLLYAKDGTRTYFIKRFDRRKGRKLYLEDFGQLLGLTRDVKYNTSMENFVLMVQKHTTFPKLETQEFFLRVLFCFLTGNEDMHAKNFSLYSEDNQVFKLAPAYDLLNSTIVIKGKAQEELAVPLRGKKSRLTRDDFITYLAKERLELSPRAIDDILEKFKKSFSVWEVLIQKSFLSEKMKTLYLDLVRARRKRLGL